MTIIFYITTAAVFVFALYLAGKAHKPRNGEEDDIREVNDQTKKLVRAIKDRKRKRRNVIIQTKKNKKP